MKDYHEGYDLLINGFDFDCTWCNSLAFKRLKENTYQITYNKNAEKSYNIFVKINKREDQYQIEDILLK